MSLNLVAIPIGNAADLSTRAREILRDAEVVIGEERKEVSKLLKSLDAQDKPIELLNEHSRPADLESLLDLCRTRKVALVSDCGTPGFCDPGAALVRACREAGISVSPVPGASSLMCLLSVCGHEMREFLFRGFLPADREERARALRELERERRPIILMDTPYRLSRLMDELAERWPNRRAVLGCDFTQSSEEILGDRLSVLATRVKDRKAEFILALFPDENSQDATKGKSASRHVDKRPPSRRPFSKRR